MLYYNMVKYNIKILFQDTHTHTYIFFYIKIN